MERGFTATMYHQYEAPRDADDYHDACDKIAEFLRIFPSMDESQKFISASQDYAHEIYRSNSVKIKKAGEGYYKSKEKFIGKLRKLSELEKKYPFV